MKKNLLILLAVFIVSATAYFLLSDTAVAPVNEGGNTDQGKNAGRGMSIEQYVTENISALSPEPAVLGGTFYVTEIEAEGGKGVVYYEDGHIALVADFNYTIDEEHGGISITSFTVRK